MSEARHIEIAAAGCRDRLRADLAKAPPDLEKALQTIADRLFDPGFGVRDLERALGEGAGDRLELLSLEIGQDLDCYLTELRLMSGLRLLLESELIPTKISRLIGYRDRSSFNKACQRHFGLSPLEIRRQARAEGTCRQPLRLCAEEPPAELRPMELAAVDRVRVVGRLAEEMGEALADDLDAAPRRLESEFALSHRALFDFFLEQSREAGRQDRRRGLALMEAALAAVEGSAALLGDQFGDLHALALAWLGNARLLAGDFAGAESAFQRAREAWEHPRLRRDVGIEAAVLALEATILLFQRRYEEARRLLARAIDGAVKAGDLDLEISSRLQRAAAAGYQGKAAHMIPDLDAAAERLESQPHPDLTQLMGVHQELALAHLELGDLPHAEAALERAREIGARLPVPSNRQQLPWIEALLAHRQGDRQRAEALFIDVKDEFRRQNDVYSAAEAALDLALLYHEQRRHPEMIELLTRDVLPVLEVLRVHEESCKALKLLAGALEERAVTQKLLRRVRADLRHVQRS